MRKERNQGSRRSFNRVALKGEAGPTASGLCAPLSWRGGQFRVVAGAKDTPRTWPAPLDAVRDRQAAGSILTWHWLGTASASIETGLNLS
ncbi:hypothetical protein PY650_35895 [Rhizobium calliandrae]|uniref:Uncharacterized protein n=1 Tax=Rhizobium calliandrae TaxID=1312182 RepID=A0ABT7KQB7_9HYPH|nr:hypothetical protein [Rhizobium calliandrae]MDL2410826.1 hypothetical protein [Rhizobium calliandrae]